MASVAPMAAPLSNMRSCSGSGGPGLITITSISSGVRPVSAKAAATSRVVRSVHVAASNQIPQPLNPPAAAARVTSSGPNSGRVPEARDMIRAMLATNSIVD